MSVSLVAALSTASRTGSTHCTQKKVQPVEVICSLCVQFGQCRNPLCVPALKLGHPGPGDYLETRRNRSRAFFVLTGVDLLLDSVLFAAAIADLIARHRRPSSPRRPLSPDRVSAGLILRNSSPVMQHGCWSMVDKRSPLHVVVLCSCSRYKQV